MVYPLTNSGPAKQVNKSASSVMFYGLTAGDKYSFQIITEVGSEAENENLRKNSSAATVSGNTREYIFGTLLIIFVDLFARFCTFYDVIVHLLVCLQL